MDTKEEIQWSKDLAAAPREEDLLLDMWGDLQVGWVDISGQWRNRRNGRLEEPYAWSSPVGLYRKENP